MQFLKYLIFRDGFVPHGNCYLWIPRRIDLRMVSHSSIVSFCLWIAVALVQGLAEKSFYRAENSA
jgi:hypothetical protein